MIARAMAEETAGTVGNGMFNCGLAASMFAAAAEADEGAKKASVAAARSDSLLANTRAVSLLAVAPASR